MSKQRRNPYPPVPPTPCYATQEAYHKSLTRAKQIVEKYFPGDARRKSAGVDPGSPQGMLLQRPWYQIQGELLNLHYPCMDEASKRRAEKTILFLENIIQ